MDQHHHKLLLVVVAKAPVAGQVKTRLLSHFTAEEAVDLYRCFLQDRLEEVGKLNGVDLAVAFTPADSKDAFARIAGNGFDLFAQKGNDLGQRLNNIFIEKLAQGYAAVSIIDSDTPDLPRSMIARSFVTLMAGGADAVFGPCDDGGYYLVGMCRPHPVLFENIPWSTEAVLRVTLKRAERLGIRTKLLPGWNDLDTMADLIDFYGRHQKKESSHKWAGKMTFDCLSGLERFTQRFNNTNSKP